MIDMLGHQHVAEGDKTGFVPALLWTLPQAPGFIRGEYVTTRPMYQGVSSRVPY